jgi:hypothetical protein
VKCRIEYSDRLPDEWKSSKDKPVPADRFWTESEDAIFTAEDDEWPCMGIEVHIWERAKKVNK